MAGHRGWKALKLGTVKILMKSDFSSDLTSFFSNHHGGLSPILGLGGLRPSQRKISLKYKIKLNLTILPLFLVYAAASTGGVSYTVGGAAAPPFYLLPHQLYLGMACHNNFQWIFEFSDFKLFTLTQSCAMMLEFKVYRHKTTEFYVKAISQCIFAPPTLPKKLHPWQPLFLWALENVRLKMKEILKMWKIANNTVLSP